MKEIIGIIIIIAVVGTASFLLQKYLDDTSDEILSKLENLKKEIKREQKMSNKEEALLMAEEVDKKWDDINNIWSMIVVHQELDNIKLSILEVKSAIESEAFDDALEEIDKTIFLAGHIREKESLKLKNIF